MQVVTLFLGMFVGSVPMIMILCPLYFPVVRALGFDPIWFGLIMLVNLEMAMTTPPVGLLLYVMKGIAPAGTTMGEIYLAALPFLLCDAILIALVIVCPGIALWLPSLI